MKRHIRSGAAWILIALLAAGTSASGFRLISRGLTLESESRFLKWYEEHKESGGEYTLKGMLRLASGTDDTPIILDGDGKIKIICGRNDFLVLSPVVLDNPGLEIVSEGFAGVGVSHDAAVLTLKNGCIRVYGSNGIYWNAGAVRSGGLPEDMPWFPSEISSASASNAVYGQGRTASGSNADSRSVSFAYQDAGTDSFRIEVTGNEQFGEEGMNTFGIRRAAFSDPDGATELSLSGLEISVSGTESCGISNPAGGVTLDRTVIYSRGDRVSYGVWAGDEIRVTGSHITATGENGAALYSESGRTVWDGDSLITGPEAGQEGLPEYYVEGEEETLPGIAVRAGTAPSELKLPEKVSVRLGKTGAGSAPAVVREIEIERWDMSAVDFEAAGIYTAEGILNGEALDKAGAGNTGNYTAKQRIYILDESGTFIDDLRFDKELNMSEDGAHPQIWCLKPEGAVSLYVEYSQDGTVWTAAGYGGGKTNFMEDYYTLEGHDEYGRIVLSPVIPFRSGKCLLRLRTVGGGVFEGAGKPVELDLGEGTASGTMLPDSGSDGSSGDRGGGSYHSVPGRKPQTGPGFPVEAGEKNGETAAGEAAAGEAETLNTGAEPAEPEEDGTGKLAESLIAGAGESEPEKGGAAGPGEELNTGAGESEPEKGGAAGPAEGLNTGARKSEPEEAEAEAAALAEANSGNTGTAGKVLAVAVILSAFLGLSFAVMKSWSGRLK